MVDKLSRHRLADRLSPQFCGMNIVLWTWRSVSFLVAGCRTGKGEENSHVSSWVELRVARVVRQSGFIMYYIIYIMYIHTYLYNTYIIGSFISCSCGKKSNWTEGTGLRTWNVIWRGALSPGHQSSLKTVKNWENQWGEGTFSRFWMECLEDFLRDNFSKTEDYTWNFLKQIRCI